MFEAELVKYGQLSHFDIKKLFNVLAKDDENMEW